MADSDFGGNLWGANDERCGVRFIFGESLDYGYVDLPQPMKNGRSIDPKRQVKKRSNIQGNLFTKYLGFHAQIKLAWRAPSDLYINYLMRVANHSKNLTVIPFFPVSKIGEDTAEFFPTFNVVVSDLAITAIQGNNAVGHDYTLTLDTVTMLSKWYNPDDHYLIRHGGVTNNDSHIVLIHAQNKVNHLVSINYT